MCILYEPRREKPIILHICEIKDADQLRGNREADQRLCFRYTDSTIPLLLEIQRPYPLGHGGRLGKNCLLGLTVCSLCNMSTCFCNFNYLLMISRVGFGAYITCS